MSAKKTTSETSHTPTPWTFTESTLNGEPTGEAMWLNHGHDEAHILINAYAGRIDQARADAAFIVRAVNNHEELVDLLRYLSCSFEPDSHQALFIKKAIARAEGKGE